MRDREGAEVAEALRQVGVNLHVSEAGDLYFSKLAGVYDPEEKRRIIGELFIEVQGQEVPRLGLNAEEWYLGQGTIYPDTIESGSTKTQSQDQDAPQSRAGGRRIDSPRPGGRTHSRSV